MLCVCWDALVGIDVLTARCLDIKMLLILDSRWSLPPNVFVGGGNDMWLIRE